MSDLYNLVKKKSDSQNIVKLILSLTSDLNLGKNCHYILNIVKRSDWGPMQRLQKRLPELYHLKTKFRTVGTVTTP